MILLKIADRPRWKLALEAKAQDCWIGAYWRKTVARAVCHCGEYVDTPCHNGHPIVYLDPSTEVEIWVCLIPCFPFHLSLLV